ncbi:MAG: hypothetical protein ACYS76_11555 [Planctomycetota bacterium]|jgi:uncharacterized membrane protein
MTLPRILNNKFVAVIAAVFGLGYFLGGLSSEAVLLGTAWLLGAAFIWKKQIWATMLMTVLAVYTLVFDVLLEMPNFRATVNEMAADIEIGESFKLALAGCVVAFEAIVLLCVICYGVKVLTRKVEKVR